MVCRVEGCKRKGYARELCEMHYRRGLRHGDVLAETPARGEGDPKVCAVPDCSRPVATHCWCHGHYLRWYRTGDVQAYRPLNKRQYSETCTVEGCGRGSHAKGLCRSHYRRSLKHGDVRADLPVRIVTGDGSFSHGYWKVQVPPELRHLTNGEPAVGEHRLVMAQHLGRALYPDEVVHHRNGVRTDNRFENLELWSTAHCKGQRVEEKVVFAVEMLRRYRPDLLTEGP